MLIHLSLCESDVHFKTLVIEYIQRTLTYNLVDYYCNGFELVNRLYFKQNNFLLIDVFTPIMTGMEAIKILRNKKNFTPIIAYSQVYQEDIHKILSTYEGIYYCQKNSAVIFALLAELNKGNMAYYEDLIAQWQVAKIEVNSTGMQEKEVLYQLSTIELRIIHRACKGLTNREIGEQVHLSGRTIEAHIKKLTEKFRVKNKIQLITYCVEQNLHNYQ